MSSSDQPVSTPAGAMQVPPAASAQPFRVAVTGDATEDLFTRYVSGCLDDKQEECYPEVVYDLEVPTGAALHLNAISSLLGWGDDRVFDWTFKSLSQTLQFVQSFEWHSESVLRIARSAPFRRPPDGSKQGLASGAGSVVPGCLVIHDATNEWRNSPDAGELLDNYFAGLRTPSDCEIPRVLVTLGDSLPNLTVDPQTKEAKIPGKEERVRSPVWTALMKQASRVAIICSATSLRHAGAAISRRLSWEQTVEETISDLARFETLHSLSQCRHLIIRFGFAGVLHIERVQDKQRAQFIFAPTARDGIFRDAVDDGRVIGRKAVTVACLLREIASATAKGAKKLHRERIAAALRTNLVTGMRLFDCGFPCPSCKGFEKEDSDELGKTFLRSFFVGGKHSSSPGPSKVFGAGYDALIKEPKAIRRDRILGTVEVPEWIIDPKPGRGQKVWQILRREIEPKKISRINLGIAICKYGHERILNRSLDVNHDPNEGCGVTSKTITQILAQPECKLYGDDAGDEKPLRNMNKKPVRPRLGDRVIAGPCGAESIYIPVLTFGKLVAIERDEIESFRSIRNLMKTYVESGDPTLRTTRPTSIAVFGPPGSGKSFAVKQLAKSINAALPENASHLELIECNIAQFRKVDDLGHAITRIASMNNERKIPLVLFDEFDCTFEDKPLGWLKYFLAPMQDGTFYGASQTISFGRAIFVFCGGIYQTLADFDPFAQSVSSPSSELERRQAEFRDQKGPDFVSRLRGHINILSVNPDDTAPKDEDGMPSKPILRRALTLRGQIVAGGLTADQNGCCVASIDHDVLYALLTVDTYRHGTRSMEAILQMCTPIEGVIEKASLPSRAQLNMHVDAEEFLIRVQRGRFRSFSAPLAKSGHQAGTRGTGVTSEAAAAAGGQRDVDDAVRAKGSEPPHPDGGQSENAQGKPSEGTTDR